MATGNDVDAYYTTEKNSNYCTLRSCRKKIKAGEVHFRIVVWIGTVKKYIRICGTCMVLRARELHEHDPEFKVRTIKKHLTT
jgi:hypothetical protein